MELKQVLKSHIVKCARQFLELDLSEDEILLIEKFSQFLIGKLDEKI